MALDPKNPTNSQAAPAASAAAQPAPGAAQQQGLTIRQVDRPECAEIFADSVSSLYFDGQTLRLELGVTRFDEVKQNTPLTARRYPACRLVAFPGRGNGIDQPDPADRAGVGAGQCGTCQAGRE